MTQFAILEITQFRSRLCANISEIGDRIETGNVPGARFYIDEHSLLLFIEFWGVLDIAATLGISVH